MYRTKQKAKKPPSSTHTLDLWIHFPIDRHIYSQRTWRGGRADGSEAVFNTLNENLTEAEMQQAAEQLGSVITADNVSGGQLPWLPAATGAPWLVDSTHLPAACASHLVFWEFLTLMVLSVRFVSHYTFTLFLTCFHNGPCLIEIPYTADVYFIIFRLKVK